MTTADPMRITRVLVADVIVPPARRAAAHETVIGRLMRSIERRGLLSPVRIRGDLRLVCGLHRLIAHERLGLTEIEAIICEGDDIEAELDELEENLERKDLTVLERAVAERRQKDLYLQRNPTTKQGVAGAIGKHRPELQAKDLSFAAAQATSGSGKRMVEQRIQIADALPDGLVTLLAEKPIANNHTQLLALARVQERLRHDVAVQVAAGKVKTVDAALLVVAGTPKITPKKRSSESQLEGRLIPTSDGLVGAAIVKGERFALSVDPGFRTFALQPSPRAEPPNPLRDDRILTVPISVTLAAETVSEFPADLATVITVTTVTVENPRYCGECGSARFWRGAKFDYICIPCNPSRCAACEIRFVDGTCAKCDSSELWFRKGGTVRRCAACTPPPECDCDAIWERLYWGPFCLRDRVVLGSPRLAQTITCSSTSRGLSRRIELRWWHAADRMRGEPSAAVLLEISSVRGTTLLVLGRRMLAPSSEDVREALRVAILKTLSITHDIQLEKRRWYRTDGTEVRLVRAAPSSEPGTGVWPLPLRP